MAQIPLGNFGNVIAQSPQGRVIDTGGSAIAQGLMNASQALNQVSEIKQKENQEKNNSIFAIESANYSSDLNDLNTDIKQRIALGELNEFTAKAELDEKAKILSADYENKIPLPMMDKFKQLTTLSAIDATQTYGNIAFDSDRRQTLTATDTALENTFKIENNDQRIANAMAIIDNNPYLNDAEKAKARMDYNNRSDRIITTKAIETASSEGSLDKLNAIQEQLEKNAGELTPEQVNAYNANINNEKARIVAKQEQEARKIEQQAKSDYSEYKKEIDTGFPVALDRREVMINNLAGSPEMQKELLTDIAVSDQFQKFKTLPIAEQQNITNKLRSNLNTNGSKDPIRDSKFLSMIESYSNEQTRIAQNTPMDAISQQTGVKYYTPDRSTIIGGIVDAKEASVSAQAIEQKHNQDRAFSLNYINKADMDAIKEDYANGDTKRKLTITQNLKRAGGGNRNVTYAMFSDMYGQDKAITHLAVTSYLDTPIAKSKQAVPNMIEGLTMMEDGRYKTVMPTNENDMKLQFNKTGLYKNMSSQDAKVRYDLTKAVYISKMSAKQEVKLDDKGNPRFDKEEWKNAEIAVNGGVVYKQSLGTNSNAVIKPESIDDRQFNIRIYNSAQKFYKDNNETVPAGLMSKYALRNTNNPHVYIFIDPKGQPLKSKNGKIVYANIPLR